MRSQNSNTAESGTYRQKIDYILMKNKKNEELQSRREFFKKAAKGALPIIAATVLASAPAIVKAAEPQYGCWGDCSTTCAILCAYNCANDCTGSCRYGCEGSCKNGCYTTCRGDCEGSCKNTCDGRCSGNCGYSSNYTTPQFVPYRPAY